MPDMRRVRRAYDFFCFRRIPAGRNEQAGRRKHGTKGGFFGTNDPSALHPKNGQIVA